MAQTVIKYNGHKIFCYGTMNETASIGVVCNDENEDGIVAEGFQNWTLAVHAIVDSGSFPSGVVELESDS